MPGPHPIPSSQKTCVPCAGSVKSWQSPSQPPRASHRENPGVPQYGQTNVGQGAGVRHGGGGMHGGDAP